MGATSLRRRTSASWLLAPACAAALSFGIAACGGSDDGGSGAALSKTEFLQQADAICKKATDKGKSEVDRLLPEDSHQPTDAQLRQVLDVAVASYRSQADDIQALHEPSSISDDVATMLKDLRAGASRIDDAGTKAFDADAPNYLATAAKDAKALGFKKCGQG
jgi:hypothetical protein